MKRNKIIQNLLVFIVSSLIIFSGFGLLASADDNNLWNMQDAQDKENLSENFSPTSEAPDLRQYVVNLIKLFLTMLGMIFVVLILWAGFNWMTSRGETAAVDKAKAQIKASIIGILIILAAYAITIFVTTIYDRVIFQGGTIGL
jgi:cytochrome b subunit of formate dehydrogenase